MNEPAKRPSDQILHHTYDDAAVGLCYLDTDLRYVHINKWLAQLNCLPVEKHLGRTIHEVIPEVAAGIEAQLRQVIETNTPIIEGTVEAETVAQPGVRRLFMHNYIPVAEDNGKVIGVSCLVQDITARKTAEVGLKERTAELEQANRDLQHALNALKWSEKRFRSLYAKTPVMLHSIDPDGRIVSVSDHWLETLGYRRNEVIGRAVTSFLTEASRERAETKIMPEVMVTGILKDEPLQFRKKHGEVVDALLSVVVEREVDGSIIRTLAVAIDVTERKRAEETLAASEARYRAIVEDQTEFIVRWLPDGTRTFVNDAYCRYFGSTRDEMIGTSFFPLVAEVDLEWVRREIEGMTPEEPARTGEHRVNNPSGSIGWQRWTDRAIFNDHGELREIQSVGRDITERKQAQAKIEALTKQLELENLYLREEVTTTQAFGEIVGRSASLRNVVQQIDLVAPTEASVLITGETGTGKELVAREIHRRSERRNKPLIKVNCPSIPRELYESEFFGHAKGAFTGATRDRAGRFEAAAGGTLFLDEVGGIPFELQNKLLRVLQEGQYERVGEERTRSVDVRIIAATNRDLKHEVEAGRFREDLFYRLNVFPIEVAPIRHRIDDIPLLADHFLKTASHRLNRQVPGLTRVNVRQLQAYDWPGNVRELQNVIERAVITSRMLRGLRFDLSAGDAGEDPSRAVAFLTEAGAKQEVVPDAEMRRRERDNVLAALRRSGWQIYGIAGAAEILGVKPTTLSHRIKKMGLRKPPELG